MKKIVYFIVLTALILQTGFLSGAWYNSLPTRYTFTAQYSYMDDPNTSGATEGFGLMYYGARWYDPALGRFTQPDTIVPSGPQGYDRYAYTNNNPVIFRDPTGHVIDQGSDGGCVFQDACTPPKSGVEQIQQFIDHGRPDMAIKLAVIYYNINLQGASVSYVKTIPDDPDAYGETPDKNQVLISEKALKSPGVLAATIYHESIHVDQFVDGHHYDSGTPWWYNEKCVN